VLPIFPYKLYAIKSPPRYEKAGWFHTSREKLKSSFKASPLNKGRGLERGKNLCFKTRNTDFHIFLFSYETTLPPRYEKGRGIC
jgi:hypothetical protein